MDFGISALEDIAKLDIPPYLIIVTLIFASFVIMLILKRFILGRIKKLVALSPFTFDTLLVNSLEFPTFILISSFNIFLLNHLLIYFNYSIERIYSLLNISALTLLISAIVIFMNSFITGLVTTYATRSPMLNNSQAIIKGITRTVILSIGTLVILSTLGISITPIIASLGITSLAVALALQPTLENFFSGIQLVMDKPIRVGDFIELDSGEQGFVEKIGWRSTWIKMLANNTIVIPNSILSNSKVINYFYPEKQLSVPVDVGVHYDSDLEHVERVTLDVAKSILKTHKWGVSDYDTFVIFHTFDDSSINFTVMLRAQEYFNRFFIKSEFIKALHKRFKEEGITIPYPIRAINTSQEGAEIIAKNED